MIDRAVKWVMALAAMWAVAACGLVDDTPTYRYRLTVEVETPQGLRTGSRWDFGRNQHFDPVTR